MLAGTFSRTVGRAAITRTTLTHSSHQHHRVLVVPVFDTRGQHCTRHHSTAGTDSVTAGPAGGVRRRLIPTGVRLYCTTDMDVIPKKALRQGSTCPVVKKDTLRLYSMRFCPYALRTRLALTHKNISHETVNINLVDKPDWFLAKNPKGLVPVLEYNDKIVYESAICNDYLDVVYPDVRLNPTDPYIRARMQILMDRYEPIARGFYRVTFAPTMEDKAKAMDRITKAMKALDAHLEKDFFGGDNPGMFDFYAYPHLAIFDFIVNHQSEIRVSNAMGGYTLPLDVVPKLAAWLQRMKRVPAVVKNTEKPADMIRFIESWMDRHNGIDYDAGLAAAKL